MTENIAEDIAGEDQNIVQLDRTSLYEIMVRNGWFLPSKNCACVTVEYMLAVRERRIFCPKFKDINIKPCPTPPKMEELLEYIRRLEAE